MWLVRDLCWLASFQDKMPFHCKSWVVVQDSSAFWSIFSCVKSRTISINDEFMEIVLLPKFLTFPSCSTSSVLPQLLPPPNAWYQHFWSPVNYCSVNVDRIHYTILYEEFPWDIFFVCYCQYTKWCQMSHSSSPLLQIVPKKIGRTKVSFIVFSLDSQHF